MATLGSATLLEGLAPFSRRIEQNDGIASILPCGDEKPPALNPEPRKPLGCKAASSFWSSSLVSQNPHKRYLTARRARLALPTITILPSPFFRAYSLPFQAMKSVTLPPRPRDRTAALLCKCDAIARDARSSSPESES